MSNQVYANAGSKYMTQPGNNIVTIIGHLMLPQVGYLLKFENQMIDIPNIISIGGILNTSIIALISGNFLFNFNFNFHIGTNPETTACQMSFIIKLTNDNGITTLCTSRNYYPGNFEIASGTPQSRSVSLFSTVYMRPGNTISIEASSELLQEFPSKYVTLDASSCFITCIN